MGVCVKLLFVILTRELEGEERELEVGEVYEVIVDSFSFFSFSFSFSFSYSFSYHLE